MTVLLLVFVAMVQLRSPIEAERWSVYLRRAGPARIGMTVNQVRRVLGDPKAYLAYAEREPDDSDCAYLQSAAKPERLRFMFQQGRLVRIDVDEPLIRTKSGAGIGDTEEKIQRLYPEHIKVEQHKYLTETGHYLTYGAVDPQDRAYGMVFETEDGRVITFRVGTLSAIALVERCS